MKEFPTRLRASNKGNFPQIAFERNICYLRRDIFEHVTTHEENDYFDLEAFSKERLQGDHEALAKMTEIVMEELGKMGWNCKTSFGGTGLFIYSTDEPPPSCFEDGL